jgi:hypothetical protein
MCEQCSAEVDDYGHPLDGWMLCQATRDADMKKGQWGLVECNDPTYVWTQKPMIDPLMGAITDDDWAKVTDIQMAESEIFEDAVALFSEELVADIESAHHLFESGLKAGYKKEHGRFESWLFNHLAQWLLAHPEPVYRNRMNLGEIGDKDPDWLTEQYKKEQEEKEKNA